MQSNDPKDWRDPEAEAAWKAYKASGWHKHHGAAKRPFMAAWRLSQGLPIS